MTKWSRDRRRIWRAHADTAGQKSTKIEDRVSLTCAVLSEIIEINDLSGAREWLETCMYEIWTMI
jgi:hypothetical protein